MGHFIVKCSCGKVINQCRCIGEKVETVIEGGCGSCHNSRVQVTRIGSTWKLSAYNLLKQVNEEITIGKEDWKCINEIIHEHYHGED